MKKLHYKILVTVIVIVILAGMFFLYLRPLEMSDLLNKDQTILITLTELYVQNGEVNMETESYNDLTEEQRENIFDLFDQYTYRRSFFTLISDGALSDLGDDLINIYLYENDHLAQSIVISSTDRMSVNDKVYVLKNSSGLIEQMKERIFYCELKKTAV